MTWLQHVTFTVLLALWSTWIFHRYEPLVWDTLRPLVPGHVAIPPARLLRWADSADANNAHCASPASLLREAGGGVADACEDVAIHHASSTAILACGHPRARTK